MSHPISIICADRSEIFLMGLEIKFKDSPDIKLLACTTVKESFQKAVDELKPDIVLFELDLEDFNGMELCRWLEAHHPNVKRVVFSDYRNVYLMKQMEKAGLHGYIMKNICPASLISCLEAVAAGHNSYCEEFMNVKENKVHEIEKQFSELEADVLRMLCLGYETNDIAVAVNRGISSINGYRVRLAEKIGTKNPFLIGVIACLLGWIDADECVEMLRRKRME